MAFCQLMRGAGETVVQAVNKIIPAIAALSVVASGLSTETGAQRQGKFQ